MTTITALPDAPSRADPATFSDKADAFVAALPTFGTQTNAVASEVNGYATSASNSAAVAIASANFKGAWSSLTGALVVPACVLHSSKLWLLVANVADVTAHTPGVSASWVELETLTHAATADLATNATLAANATKLATSRTVAVTGKATGTATSFDGSENISIPITATDSIGEGQTWQNMLGSRALDTAYTNSTGRSICLMIRFEQTADTWSIGYVYCGGGLTDPIYAGGFGTASATSKGGIHVATVIVPPGEQYKVVTAGGSPSETSVTRWYELR